MVENWKGPLEVIWSNIPAQVAPPKVSHFEYLQKLALYILATWTMFGHHCSEKVSSDVQKESPVFHFVPLASGPVTGTTVKQQAPCSLHSPFSYLCILT